MSAFEIIEYFKELPAAEQEQVAKYIIDNSTSATGSQFSVGIEVDGLPVIRADGGILTSQLVHEIESRIP
jgi:hypothetical protein